MARLSRLVLPGLPYHVTQRGNRRSQTFFEGGDYELYRNPLGASASNSVELSALVPDRIAGKPCRAVPGP
jgi:REP element-mobilizing transposase RayT